MCETFQKILVFSLGYEHRIELWTCTQSTAWNARKSVRFLDDDEININCYHKESCF